MGWLTAGRLRRCAAVVALCGVMTYWWVNRPEPPTPAPVSVTPLEALGATELDGAGARLDSPAIASPPAPPPISMAPDPPTPDLPVVTVTPRSSPSPKVKPTPSRTPKPTPSPTPSVDRAGPAAVAPPNPSRLPTIGYEPAPDGFPADLSPLSTVRVQHAVRPTRTVTLYDGVRGNPRALLPTTIRGAEVVLPVVEVRDGWYAVMLPSANRRIAWLPADSLDVVPLSDQVVVERGARRMTWYHDGAPVAVWLVTIGATDTPTPLGRTYVFGRSTLDDSAYGGVDVLALGAIPEYPENLPPSLLGAHIGIHAWHHDGDLGKATSDGCVRVTRPQQAQLLDHLIPGTVVVILP